MPRTMEPEVMDNEANAKAYARADFSKVNQDFVDRLLEAHPDLRRAPASIVDLGCGPADIPRRLALAAPRARVVAVDASERMLELGRRALKASPVAAQVKLVLGRLPDVMLPPKSFDAVISNSLVHHLPDPSVFWSSAAQLAKDGGAVYVMDLFRPESDLKAREIVETAAKDEDPILKEDFYNSLLAAFTLDEVRAQLANAGLSRLRAEYASERHWLVSGRL
ncbi:MAG: class I SAM-dependent methyltransferase [Proteobacteria bacterium]|nr:class I SAM-dependent methyltransferase [Pseudomonadota bacterium]